MNNSESLVPDSLRLTTFIFLATAAGCFGCGPPEPSGHRILKDAVNYLWEQQQSDGSWRSPTHGIAAGGEAWTPFILFNLMNVPDTVASENKKGIESALEYIRSHVSHSGVLGTGDPLVLEYPNYATAYALRSLVKEKNPADENLRMVVPRQPDGQSAGV